MSTKDPASVRATRAASGLPAPPPYLAWSVRPAEAALAGNGLPRRLPSTGASRPHAAGSIARAVPRPYLRTQTRPPAGCGFCSCSSQCPRLPSARCCSGAGRARTRPGSATSPHLSSLVMRFYLTTPIYYVNRPRTSGTPTRRSPPTCSCGTTASAARRPSSSPGSTSTHEGLPVRRGAGAVAESTSTGSRGVARAALPSERRNDFFIRTSDEGHKRSSASSSSGSTTAATSTRTLRRPRIASAARRSRRKPTSSTGSAPSHDRSSPSGSRRRTTSSGSPRSRSSCWRSTTRGPTWCCRSSATTRREASSPAACRTSRSAARGTDLGHPVAVGREPGRLRVGGRARQLIPAPSPTR